jgi:hypothetical protein
MIRTIEGDRFDSILDLSSIESGHHANLEIHLKVCLQKFEPPAGQARLRYRQATDEHASDIIVSRWPAGTAWADWCRRFETEAGEYFHGRLWLAPSGPWIGSAPVPGSGGRMVFRPGVRCGFRVSRVSMDRCHFIADVAYTTGDSDFFRSYQTQRSGLDETRDAVRGGLGLDDTPENLATFYRACFAGSGRLMLSDGDLDPTVRNKFNTSFSQRTFLHELGHALGLDHVNGAGNNDDAYGATAHQAGDLMGSGERLEPWHAFPWRARLDWHLRPGERPERWTATIRRPPVSTERVYPPPTIQGVPPSGGVGSLDGGVAARCPVRGNNYTGPLGTAV